MNHDEAFFIVRGKYIVSFKDLIKALSFGEEYSFIFCDRAKTSWLLSGLKHNRIFGEDAAPTNWTDEAAGEMLVMWFLQKKGFSSWQKQTRLYLRLQRSDFSHVTVIVYQTKTCIQPERCLFDWRQVINDEEWPMAHNLIQKENNPNLFE